MRPDTSLRGNLNLPRQQAALGCQLGDACLLDLFVVVEADDYIAILTHRRAPGKLATVPILDNIKNNKL